MLEQMLGQSDDLQHFDILVKMGWTTFLESQIPLS